MKFEFAIDRGGTFTDIYARIKYESQNQKDKIITMKLLSSDPLKYTDAPTEGIRRIMEMEGLEVPKGSKIDGKCILSIRMGTTVGTNALLERKGARTALLVTQGFKQLLKIGNQTRPDIFDLKVKSFPPLYEEVVEVKERVVPCLGNSALNIANENPSSGEPLCILTPLDEDQVKHNLMAVRDKGISSLSVVLMHSYGFPDHELKIGALAHNIGFENISLSSQVNPMTRIVPRGHTCCTDAYLTPCIKEYLKNFTEGFVNQLTGVNVLFMQSDGGLTPMNKFNGSHAILSGPAGGYIGYALTSYGKESELPVIGFDMGGTSTDVSRYNGRLEHIMETNISGITIQSPQLDISTVAAGGGSILSFQSGLFKVGPHSAGAHPGPLCYRNNGPLTITDANLYLGRIIPSYFPKIFGPDENLPLDKAKCVEVFEKLSEKINAELARTKGRAMSVEEVAYGFLKVANETMCRPIRAITEARGYDTREHALACFGGAGGQHACDIARILGINTVIIHKYSGILSAYGMALADVVSEAQEPCKKQYSTDNFSFFDGRFEELGRKCSQSLLEQGFMADSILLSRYLHMRYDRTDCGIMCLGVESPEGCKYGDFESVFISRYKQEFGFILPDRAIYVDDIRVRGVAVAREEIPTPPEVESSTPSTSEIVQVYFEGGYRDTKVYSFDKLLPGSIIDGPSIIMDNLSTVIVDPYSKAYVTKYGNIKIELGQIKTATIDEQLDSINLSIFSHRFMSIAEQMGRKLQRTSISTNIKERLDFSCAIFGPDGGLVSNAPHIPVHLGAMQAAVQYQIGQGPLDDGDVILSNHPIAGGSHLPDLTVITPVFYEDNPKPVFFVANRGHHADVGGLTPGSMPPNSKTLIDEGASFISFKMVEKGVFQEDELKEMLMLPGKYPGNSGSRTIPDNIADLKAQIAANQKGIRLVSQLIEHYTLAVVQAYMFYIQENAEQAVRGMLKEIGKELIKNTGRNELYGRDSMDDGSEICLKVSLDVVNGNAEFDFSGTSYETYGNLNAPKAITLSAIIYCLRAMIGHDIPLNQGCMTPITTIIPKGSLLDPSLDAAVVGGNVLTSQRIVDVILKTFHVCAASQGCMNNLTFGDESMGYYETIAGGAGAGPTWEGTSGVHTHMTNTRMTDPEIVENRYPVTVKKFSLRENSGGQGKFRGGDGIIRELMFRKALTVSLLTERRVTRPYGLEGGKDGEAGLNLLFTGKGKIINLGGKVTVQVSPGDILKIFTPGGGGYGAPCNRSDNTTPHT